MILFDDVSKKYGEDSYALKDVNLTIEQGEFVFVLGPSGAGKSTFLKLIMHEEKPTRGEVVVNGFNSSTIKPKDVPYLRRSMGIVFQDFRLIPSMNVFDNVAFSLRVIGASEREIRKRVPYALDLVELSGKAKSCPPQLSGGEQQRVALARALVNNPSLIIADEPTGNIDPRLAYDIVDLLSQINKNGTTVLMVTHQHDLVQKFPRRTITIVDGNIIGDEGLANAGEEI